MTRRSVQLGLSRHLVPIPGRVWQRVLHRDARQSGDRLAFMSADHHRVRDFCVVELARRGEPLEPEAIASGLDMETERVIAILDELEDGMTFVYRSRGRAVTWAYPVTVDPTPQEVKLSSGEVVNAA